MEQVLSKETFIAVCEMIASHLRIREADRWSQGGTAELKYVSFRSQYPEVNDTQFLWCGEQWIQDCPAGFVRYPTWRELMVYLYRSEGGQANRSWGFRDDLPDFVAPTLEQRRMASGPLRPLLSAPDRTNTDAYVVIGRAGEAERRGLRPVPVEDPPLLAPGVEPGEDWEELIQLAREYDPDAQERDGTAGDP